MNRLAVKFELSRQGFKDFDSISLVAKVYGDNVRNEAMRAIDEKLNCIAAV